MGTWQTKQMAANTLLAQQQQVVHATHKPAQLKSPCTHTHSHTYLHTHTIRHCKRCMQGRMGAEWLDETDCVGSWQNERLAAVLFPTADTLTKVRQLARVKGPHRLMLLINPQWQTDGQVVSDFGCVLGFLGISQAILLGPAHAAPETCCCQVQGYRMLRCTSARLFQDSVANQWPDSL